MPENWLLGTIPDVFVQQIRSGLLELKPAEIRVLGPMTQGATALDISLALGITVRTVNTHAHRILAQCGCQKYMLLRVLCYELIDDHELFRALEEKVRSYPANSWKRRPKSAGPRETPSRAR